MPLAKMRSMGAVVAALGGVGVELVEVAAGPELALELLVVAAHALQAEQLAEDHRPAGQRGEQQAGHHQLHDPAGVQDQVKMECPGSLGNVFGMAVGMRRGRKFRHRRSRCGCGLRPQQHRGYARARWPAAPGLLDASSHGRCRRGSTLTSIRSSSRAGLGNGREYRRRRTARLYRFASAPAKARARSHSVRALEELQVVRVEHHAAGVGVFPIHAQRGGTGWAEEWVSVRAKPGLSLLHGRWYTGAPAGGRLRT